jgi:hypothetical protein
MRLLILLAFFLCGRVLEANEASEPNVIILPAGSVYNGDYFVCGTNIEISGTVNGDVYAFGEQIIIDGTVNGDVLACGGSIDVSGAIRSNLRGLAGQVLVNGKVGSNVTAIAGSLQLFSGAQVGGSLVAVAGNAELAGHIGTNATLVASNLRVCADIAQNLKSFVGHMRITSRARVGQNVDYRSNVPASIDEGAYIGGQLIHHPSLLHELIKGTWIQKVLVGSKVLALLMNFVYSLCVGIVLIKLFPRNLGDALQALGEKPLKSFGFGLILLFVLPLASLILLMTILGIPFAITIIALNIIGLYTAKVYSICFVSNWAFGAFLKRNHIPNFFCGLVVYFILTLIPVLGTLLALVSMLFGLGAGVLAQAKKGLLNK